jgi:hypothetical protein
VQIAQWNTVRVSAAAFKCEHFSATAMALLGATVRAFMREQRGFERTHDAYAPATRAAAPEAKAPGAIDKAK